MTSSKKMLSLLLLFFTDDLTEPKYIYLIFTDKDKVEQQPNSCEALWKIMHLCLQKNIKHTKKNS